jgi:hypothetical protein
MLYVIFKCICNIFVCVYALLKWWNELKKIYPYSP